MNQKWGSCERSLQRLKGIFSFNSLGKRMILPSQTSKRGHYHGIVCNDSLIEVGKPKKTLNITNKSWGSPIHNGLNLMRVHANVISKNNLTKEFHFKLMESTLFQFDTNANFSELFQQYVHGVHGLPCSFKK